jgi:hypothetical protein
MASNVSRPRRCNMAPEIKIKSPAWLQDIYRRIQAGESLHDLAVTESAYYARIIDKAEREKMEAEAAEARRRAGGRPAKLNADQITDTQTVVRRCLAKGVSQRKILILTAQQHLRKKHGIQASDSTVIRHIVEPVRGIRKISRNRF